MSKEQEVQLDQGPRRRGLLARLLDPWRRNSVAPGKEVEATPRSWKERMTYVADNAKGDKEAPSYFRGKYTHLAQEMTSPQVT